jgi:hypothetical protein
MSFFLVCFVNVYYIAHLSYFLYMFCFCICTLYISLYHSILDYENKDAYFFGNMVWTILATGRKYLRLLTLQNLFVMSILLVSLFPPISGDAIQMMKNMYLRDVSKGYRLSLSWHRLYVCIQFEIQYHYAYDIIFSYFVFS